MSKVDIAEWILSFTTNRERAASTAGDLLEESLPQGSVCFWWSLARTTTSLIWRELTLYPLQMVRLGFVALVLTAISIPVIIVVGITGGLFVSFVLDVSGLTTDSAVFLGTGFAIVGSATLPRRLSR
jgi:hypothetical protein